MNDNCNASLHVLFLFSLPVSPLVVTLVIQFWLKYPEASSSWSTSQAIFSVSLVLCLSMSLLLYFPLCPPTGLHECVCVCASVGPPLNHLQMSSPNTSSHLPFFSMLSSPLPDEAVTPLPLLKWLPSSTVCGQIYDNNDTLKYTHPKNYLAT